MWTDAQFVNNTLQMNWNSPYTLENVPILAYHIDVNQTHEYVCNATTTSLTVMDFSLEECFWYVLTITARNSVGQSEKNSLSLFYPGGNSSSFKLICTCKQPTLVYFFSTLLMFTLVPYQVNSEDINTTVVIMNQGINVEVNMKVSFDVLVSVHRHLLCINIYNVHNYMHNLYSHSIDMAVVNRNLIVLM